MESSEKEEILVGSCDVYAVEFSGNVPDDATIEAEENLLGHVKSGATISYKPTYKDFSTDDGKKKKYSLTAEEAGAKFNLGTWKNSKFGVYAATARVSAVAGKRTVKIGGLSKDSKKKYLFRFVHLDEDAGDVRVTEIAKSSASGFDLAFAAEDMAVMPCELKALPADNDGTLLQIDISDESIEADATSGS